MEDLKLEENQEKLIEVLDSMFHYDVDPIKKTKKLGINPKLKKETFIQIVLPLVVAENERILEDREKLKLWSAN